MGAEILKEIKYKSFEYEGVYPFNNIEIDLTKLSGEDKSDMDNF